MCLYRQTAIPRFIEPANQHDKDVFGMHCIAQDVSRHYICSILLVGCFIEAANQLAAVVGHPMHPAGLITRLGLILNLNRLSLVTAFSLSKKTCLSDSSMEVRAKRQRVVGTKYSKNACRTCR